MKSIIKKIAVVLCLLSVVLSLFGCEIAGGGAGETDNAEGEKAPGSDPASRKERYGDEIRHVETILDDFTAEGYRRVLSETDVSPVSFGSGKNNNTAVFSFLASGPRTKPAFIATGAQDNINQSFYKLSAEPLSYAFAFLEWYKYTGAEIKDFNGIYYYYSSDNAIRITLSEDYDDMVAIDYQQYHMIIHSGAIDYEGENNTKPYVISYGFGYNRPDFYGSLEYDDPETSIVVPDFNEAYIQSGKLIRYFNGNFPAQALKFLDSLYTDKETGERLPVSEPYQEGKSNHRFQDEWINYRGNAYIGKLGGLFMSKNYNEVVFPEDNIIENDILVSTRKWGLCVVPDGIRRLAFPINGYCGVVLPDSVEGFTENDLIAAEEGLEEDIINYIFIEAAEKEYQHKDLLDLIRSKLPNVEILYRGEFEVICGVYIPCIEKFHMPDEPEQPDSPVNPYETELRDEQGRLIQKQIRNEDGTLIESIQYEYSDDKPGKKPGKESGKVYVITEKYHEDGAVERIRSYGSGEMISREYLVFDEKGNVTEEIQYDAAGNQTSRYVAEYGENGLPTKIIRYDGEDRITEKETYEYNADGVEIASVVFDGEGRKTIERRYGKDGTYEGYTKYEYYPDGRLLCETVFDAGGSPVDEHRYDEEGNPTGLLERKFYPDGTPKYEKIGLGDGRTMTRRYDGNGNAVEECFYDGNDVLTGIMKNEYDSENRLRSQTEHNYTEKGEEAVYRVFNESGELTEFQLRHDGVLLQHAVYVFGENGLLTEEKSLDESGNMIENAVYEYGANGSKSITTYRNGVIQVYQQCDEAGKTIALAHYENGIKREEERYDSFSAPVESLAYDQNGKLQRRTLTTYDDHSSGHSMLEIKTTDGNGKVIDHRKWEYYESGSLKKNILFGENDIIISEEEYHENGSPKKSIHYGEGAVIVSEYEYNEDGLPVESIEYDGDGQFLCHMRSTYDEHSNPIEQISFDKDGRELERNLYEYYDNSSIVKKWTHYENGVLLFTQTYPLE